MIKNKIRKKLLNIRNSIKNKKGLSAQINHKLINYIKIHFINPKIASYMSTSNEVNTTIVNNYFTSIYLPIIHPFIKHALWFAKDSKNYYFNHYNIKEPKYLLQEILIAYELDIILVPLLSFNKNKFRLGMGGGFYDYTLSFHKIYKYPLTIGIAFDEQQNDHIIINKHDIMLDLIITPTRIL